MILDDFWVLFLQCLQKRERGVVIVKLGMNLLALCSTRTLLRVRSENSCSLQNIFGHNVINNLRLPEPFRITIRTHTRTHTRTGCCSHLLFSVVAEG
jgi:hypothetical protein